ncbi:G2/mitotic-specific cyclin-2 [Nakaseomyces bracarensis]|uniref:G2/mitotic-specific cyclin-2 n=1 Tax=Nakaseomyces bracarensis TaxID=273131 RepID=A0ABR4NYC9_9SACH
MSEPGNNVENAQNNGTARLLRNVQRLALNNVTNTTVGGVNNGLIGGQGQDSSALRSFKTALTRNDNSFKKKPLSKPALINNKPIGDKKEVETNLINSSNVNQNKENDDPFSDKLTQITEENGVDLHSGSSVSSQTTVESTHYTTNNQVEDETDDDSTDADAKKKRPISTIVEQDLPKKFKACNRFGNEEYEWEDLDAEDANDPFMVSENVNDIFEYLHHLEVVTLPRKEDLYKHRNICQNRDILVNWLVKIHNKFGLLPETLYLAVNLMDRFLCKELVQLDKLQLVGTSCLFIASKYEEVYSPSIKHYASETDGACTEEEIKEGEKFILKTLEFTLNYPNPMNFLRRISKADDYDIQSRTLAKFLLEISLVDFRFIGILPSLCAAAAMFLSRKMLGKGHWDGNLIHYSGGYTKDQLAPVCNMIMDYLVSPIVHDEFHRKYQSRRFMKASIISVQWALKVRKNGYDIMSLHE